MTRYCGTPGGIQANGSARHLFAVTGTAQRRGPGGAEVTGRPAASSEEGFLVNAVAPGHVDTDGNNHTGFITVAQGAAVVVRLAMPGADGPLPW